MGRSHASRRDWSGNMGWATTEVYRYNHYYVRARHHSLCSLLGPGATNGATLLLPPSHWKVNCHICATILRDQKTQVSLENLLDEAEH